MAKAKPLTLSSEDRSRLESITKTRTLQAQTVTRARILLLKADGESVDSIADRISFVEFSNDNFNMQEIYDMNNPDVLFDSAIISSLITSCSFIYISQKVGEMPRLQVIDGRQCLVIQIDERLEVNGISVNPDTGEVIDRTAEGYVEE